MTPAATKILMCICAGTTGATVVPVVQKARTMLVTRKVRPHPVAVAAPVAVPRAAPVVAPSVACAPLLAGLSGVDAVGSLAAPQAADSAFATIPAGLDTMAVSDLSGVTTGGPTAFKPQPGVNPVGDVMKSSAPEPTSWALMIIGFGTLGGALRWRRLKPLTGIDEG